MNVHEYQAKALLREYGVEVPAGKLALTTEEAVEAARDLGGAVVLKAQVHAGGRGKGGGIKLVPNADAVGEVAEGILGMQLVTPQTGAEGKRVNRLYVEAATSIDRELYLALLVDRATQKHALLASTEGGMEIEEVAARTPEKILSAQIDPLVGLCDYQARDTGFALGLSPKQVVSFAKLVRGLYALFSEKDCSLAEINPLVVSGETILALDCKKPYYGPDDLGGRAEKR